MGLRDVEAALDSGWERAQETIRGSMSPSEVCSAPCQDTPALLPAPIKALSVASTITRCCRVAKPCRMECTLWSRP